jgi:heme/copper-type cytochrome/quinol oxidase subunit 3
MSTMSSDAAASSPAGARPAVGVGLPGMWTFLATDAMGFAGLFIAYAVLRVRAPSWPDPRARLPLAPAALMTVALMASSLTIARAARAESTGARRRWLGATLALGLAFLGGAVAEYAHLAAGTTHMGFASDLFASTFYALTGYHALHVLVGLIAMAVVAARAAARPAAIEVVALYWHFVDLAWMPIFTFLYLLPAS